MATNSYSKAYTEVLEILNHLSEEEYSKIPIEKIEFYKNNMDKEYDYKINPEVDLEKQYISNEANAILITLFRDYFATDKQREILKNLLRQNQDKLEQEKREKYNPNNIFKENIRLNAINKQMQVVEYKEPFINKFKRFIYKLLHINY